jgi:hypothetical protein
MPFDEEDDVSGTSVNSTGAAPSPAAGASGGAGQSQASAPPNLQPNAANDPRLMAAAAPQIETQPNNITETIPLHKSWLQNTVDGVMTALGGKQDPNAPPGQQWKRIIAGAVAGLGNTAGAGLGPGAPGRGLALGVQGGLKFAQQQQKDQQEQQKEDFDQQQTAAMNKARTSQLAVEGAKTAWELSWEKTKAMEGQLELENHWNEIIRNAGEGSADLGVYPTFHDYMKATQEDPSLHEAQVNGELYKTTHINADGQIDGIHAYRVTPNWRDQKTTEPTPIFHMVMGKKPGELPTLQTSTVPAGRLDNAKVGDILQANDNLALKWLSDKSQSELRQSQEDKNERAPAPRGVGGGAGSVDDPHVATLGEAIASGRLTTDQIPGFGKMKPQIEAYLADHHPNLNISSVMLTGDERKRADLANNALHNLEDIGQRIARRPDLLGVIQGRITQGKNLAGTNDPDLAAIDTALDNYALAATGAHGVRAVEARKDAKQAILNGFKNGQQGVQAAVQSARGSLQNLAGSGRPRSVDGTPYVYKTQPQGNPGPNPQPQANPQSGGFDPSKFAVAN